MQKDIEKGVQWDIQDREWIASERAGYVQMERSFMASSGKWYYAYSISQGTDGKNYVNVEDACHAQNIHENDTENYKEEER